MKFRAIAVLAVAAGSMALAGSQSALSDVDAALYRRVLALDLRGNPGGDVEGLKAMAGVLLGRPADLMTMVTRKGAKSETAKPKGKPFPGTLVVMIDSRSASASEILARLVQL